MESDRRVGFRVGFGIGPREPHFRATSGTRSSGWSRHTRVHSSRERESTARRRRIVREKRSGRGYRSVDVISPLGAVVCRCLFGPAGAAPPLLFHLYTHGNSRYSKTITFCLGCRRTLRLRRRRNRRRSRPRKFRFVCTECRGGRRASFGRRTDATKRSTSTVWASSAQNGIYYTGPPT